MMNIYVASSWRNDFQPATVRALAEAGHRVYDFRHPGVDDSDFHWSGISKGWRGWSLVDFVKALRHDLAVDGFDKDMTGMLIADACVMVLPCGRSAHLEAGWFVGKGRKLYIYVPQDLSDRGDLWEAELMYKMADGIFNNIDDIIEKLGETTIQSVEKSLEGMGYGKVDE